MNTKTFKVTADWFDGAEVVLRVDLDVLTTELANEINSFWGGADVRLEYENDDVIRAVVRLFGAAAIHHVMSDGGASFGPLEPGDNGWTQVVIDAQSEGWPDAEDLGIQIVAAEVAAAGFDDVSLEAL